MATNSLKKYSLRPKGKVQSHIIAVGVVVVRCREGLGYNHGPVSGVPIGGLWSWNKTNDVSS